MSKQQVTEKAVVRCVPKLRFPEFREVEGWSADALGDIATFVNEKVPVERVALENYISTENILPEYGGVAKASKLPATGSVTRYRPNDTLVSNIRPYLKKVWVADKEGGASNDVIIIRAKQSFLPQYLSCLLRNDAFIEYVMTGAKGVKMPRGDVASIKAYPALYPCKSEQQKIAACLSSLDELITAQAQKVDALKTHKKGLMQQLFPRDGESVPRVRFPEFREAGEWERERLGGLCARIMDGTHFSPKSKEGSRPYLTSKNIKNGRLDLSNLSYISEEEHAEIYSKCPVKLHDVLLTKDGANTGNCAINNLDFKFSLLSSVAVLRGNPDKLRQDFLFQSILSESVQTMISGSMSGQAITRITLAKIGAFTIPVTLLVEQQHIAACLSSLDDLITAETQKLESLRIHKKGLMQQLFPAAEQIEA